MLRNTPVIEGIPDDLSTSDAVITAIEARYGTRERRNTGAKRIRLDDVRENAMKLEARLADLDERYEDLQGSLVDAERNYDRRLRDSRNFASQVLAQSITPLLSQHTIVSYELLRDKLRGWQIELPELYA